MKNTELIKKIRVMTYNVHSCRGLDGKVLPQRIADIIAEFNPDLVALQELDVNQRWSNRIDQPLMIAQHLRLQCHFQPALAVEGGNCGIAILSRYPFEIKKSIDLPRHPQKPFTRNYIPLLKYFYTPRQAIWTSITIVGLGPVYFVNTHLSLRANERFEQIKSLLGSDWLNMDSHKVPTILCGDFNEGPGSKGYQLLKAAFKEVKSDTDFKSSKKTFFGPLPLRELDHVFYRANVRVESVSIPRTSLTKIASDHLPVVADFSFTQESS
jgi:endonuclease/exonuclease/phosphatase family metal-dependent hydrolase